MHKKASKAIRRYPNQLNSRREALPEESTSKILGRTPRRLKQLHNYATQVKAAQRAAGPRLVKDGDVVRQVVVIVESAQETLCPFCRVPLAGATLHDHASVCPEYAAQVGFESDLMRGGLPKRARDARRKKP